MLADTYTLYNSTQCAHWNVEGPRFKELHDLFEDQYQELAVAIDVIAERLRALGFYVPGTLQEMSELSRLNQRSLVEGPTAWEGHLIEGHRQVAHRLRELQALAEKTMDEATMDLLVERLRVHEKTIWMLRSLIGGVSETLVAPPTFEAAIGA